MMARADPLGRAARGEDGRASSREAAFRSSFALGFLLLAVLERALADPGAGNDLVYLYILAGAYLLYSAATSTWGGKLSLRGPYRSLVAAIDVAAVSLGIHLCGGIQTHTFLVLGLAPLIGGVYGERRGVISASLLVLSGYTAVILFNLKRLPTGYHLAQALALRYAYIVGAGVLWALVIELVTRDRNRLKIFYEISRSANKSPSLQNVVGEIVHQLADFLKAETTVIFILEESTGFLVAQQPALGLEISAAMRINLPLQSETIPVYSFRLGKAILLDREACRDMSPDSLLPGIQVIDLIACPLQARGKKIGLLVLANKLSRRGFTRHDLRMVELISPHISVFLDNAILFRRTEEKVAQLTSLIRVVDAIHTVSGLDQLYTLTLDVIRGLFAADKALIDIIDPQTGMLHVARSFGYSPEYAEKHHDKPFEPISGCFVIRHEDSFLCRDVDVDDRCPQMVVGEDTRSVLCVPIRSGEKTYGILHMASRFKDAFDEEDATLAKAIGEQIGMAVERAKLFEDISQLAVTDELTGLYNIRHLKRVLGEEIKRSLRYGRPFSFIMLDIDHFKAYNDQHGHLRGDEVLRILAGLLQQNTREVDTVFRYGGEEFSIIIPEVSKKEAFTMAERIRRVVQDYVFPYEEYQPGGNLTVSMGISGFPEDAEESDELMDKADRALYRAKTTGRNRVCLYDPEQDRAPFHPRVTQTGQPQN